LPLNNPYKAEPGVDLDRQIHQIFFPNNSSSPAPYSTDDKAAEKVRNRLKSLYRYPVVTGQTQTRPRHFYARFESGPSTSTEVLADTYPLAICRLALIVSAKHDPATH
jgi:hypothetical protein